MTRLVASCLSLLLVTVASGCYCCGYGYRGLGAGACGPCGQGGGYGGYGTYGAPTMQYPSGYYMSPYGAASAEYPATTAAPVGYPTYPTTAYAPLDPLPTF